MIRIVVLVAFAAFAAFYLLVVGAVGRHHLARRRRDATLEDDLAAKGQRLRDRLVTQRLDESLRHRTAQRRLKAASLRARAAEIESGPVRSSRQHERTRPADIVLLRRPNSAA